MFNAIHVTHEAVWKVGGIGTVLEGLINSRPYRDNIGRTILVCPLFYPENTERLGPGGMIEYSSLDNIYDSAYAQAFGQVEQEYNVRLIHGRRPLEDEDSKRRTLCEVLLVDLRGINHLKVNEFKALLWELYGIQFDRYEHIWELEQYVQLAAPALAAMEQMRLGTTETPAVIFAHEFMGLPLALAAQARYRDHYRTLFHAHETAPIRRIVEAHPGHDVMFYNTLELARKSDLYLEQVFGPQDDYHKHAIVEAAHYCDGLLAVGHHVHRELQFLSANFDDADIALAYNGVPVARVTQEERDESRRHVRKYFKNLLGWQPDLIFTHVTRLAESKAMWRDIDLLEALDKRLVRDDRTAVLLTLSTELPRRPATDILAMEREWDWPLAHREGHPDLTGGEARYYQLVQAFNARARKIKIIFVNQFGFDRARAGKRVPNDLEFLDLRRASDAELGMSLYEPFGISPLEPLTYGGICVVSTSCGCAGFVKQITGRKRYCNVILADYIGAAPRPRSVQRALEIGARELRAVERDVAEKLAEELLTRLPADEKATQKLMRTGLEMATQMSWDTVAERFILPAIRRAFARGRMLDVA